MLPAMCLVKMNSAPDVRRRHPRWPGRSTCIHTHSYCHHRAGQEACGVIRGDKARVDSFEGSSVRGIFWGVLLNIKRRSSDIGIHDSSLKTAVRGCDPLLAAKRCRSGPDPEEAWSGGGEGHAQNHDCIEMTLSFPQKKRCRISARKNMNSCAVPHIFISQR